MQQFKTKRSNVDLSIHHYTRFISMASSIDIGASCLSRLISLNSEVEATDKTFARVHAHVSKNLLRDLSKIDDFVSTASRV